MEQRLQDIQHRWKKLQNVRQGSGLDSMWQEIANYHCPDRGRFNASSSSPDEDSQDEAYSTRWSKILDSIGPECLRVAQNGLHSELTSPAQRWFKLHFTDESLSRNTNAKSWLQALEDVCYDVFRQSNFYPSCHNLYGEIMSFAQGCMYQEAHPKSTVHYRVFTAGEYWIDQDEFGVIDTLYRRIMMTPRQLLMRFGDKCSQRAKDYYKSNSMNNIEVLHAVQPRSDRDPAKADKMNMAWESLHLEVISDFNLLSESGYKTFPYVVPRFNVISNATYGTGAPGWEKLDHVKRLQDMKECDIRQTHKMVDPPIMAPDSLRGSPLRTGARDITWVSSEGQANQLKRLYDFEVNLEGLRQEMNEERQRVMKAWYVDIFMALEQLRSQARGGNVTATEVGELVKQMKVQLGPFVSRHQDEVLDPVIEFAITEIIESGRVPRPPMPVDYKVEYTGTLAQAQKMDSKGSIDEMLSFVGNVAAMKPEVIDVIDFDEAVRRRAEITGLPTEILIGEDQLKGIREARAKQQQQMQMMQSAQAAIQGAQQLSQTKTNPEDPNALTDIGKMMQGGAQ